MIAYFARRGLSRFAYSNIKLSFEGGKQAAVLTLANEKKRNPLGFDTIKEIQAALEEVEAKVKTDKIKVVLFLSRLWCSEARALSFQQVMISKNSKLQLILAKSLTLARRPSSLSKDFP
jgi:hypothetical protein